MGTVFANGMEISGKSMGGKSICAFPDVCFTPPETPATPTGVPIPYPNTGLAGDTTDGSSSVKIGDEEVMLKEKSCFKKSSGDEAGSATKKGLINSSNQGKVFFIAWSMDVLIEGENVVRHLDMTTHNHASPANEAAPMVHTASQAMGKHPACEADQKKIEEKCKGKANPCPGFLSVPVSEQRALFRKGEDVSRTAQAGAQATSDAESGKDGACVQAMRCHLRPYEPDDEKGGCCPGQTPHHIPPKSMMEGFSGYRMQDALCVCLEGASQHVGSHGENHAAIDHVASKPGVLDAGGRCTVAQYNKVCADAVEAQCDCKSECIEQQLNDSLDKHKDKKVKHWQSNSGQLSSDTEAAIDEKYDAPVKKAIRRR